MSLAGMDLNGLGPAKTRVAAVQEVARAVIEGELDFGASTECIRAVLSKLGVGAATIEYIKLRALGGPDAFPTTDSVLRQVAGTNNQPHAASELEARAEAWRPWRAYAAMHLWSESNRVLTACN